MYEVIERVSDVALLDAREQHYMDTLTPAYNVRLTAMSNRGIKRTEEVRAKLREARKLHPMPFTSETRAKIGAAHKGSKRTAETRARMSASAFKAMASPEVREKIAASKRGKKRPPHVIEAIRKATKGRKLTEDQLAQRREYAKAHNAAAPLLEAKARETEEQRVARLKKIADAHRGRKRPPEVGAKISAAKMGHTVSAVTRQKISESQRKNPRTVRPETREKYRQAALKRWHGQKLPDEG